MIVRELSDVEIKQCKKIVDKDFTAQLNQRRNYLQTLVVDHLAKTKYLLINGFTSFGKSYCCKQGLERLNRKYGTEKIHIVVVPTTNLKEEFEVVLKSIPNVQVYVVNSFVKAGYGYYENVLSLWIDEVHTVLNEHSKEFSKAFKLIDCRLKIGMSATLNKEQLQYASEIGFEHSFYIPLHIGLSLELVPPYKIYNLPIQLTEKEKQKYVQIEKEYKDYIRYFSAFSEKSTAFLIPMLIQGYKTVKWEGNFYTGSELAAIVATHLGISTGQCIGTALRWMRQVSARKNLLYNASNKFVVLEQLLEGFKDKNTVVYSFSQKKANEIAAKSPLRKPFHGASSNPQILKDFREDRLKVLSLCKKGEAGQISDNVSVAIRTYFTSQKRSLLQITGRILRFDANNGEKQGIVINEYVDDFEYKGEKYFSQDLVWLKQSLEGSRFIEFVESIEEIEELYETI